MGTVAIPTLCSFGWTPSSERRFVPSKAVGLALVALLLVFAPTGIAPHVPEVEHTFGWVAGATGVLAARPHAAGASLDTRRIVDAARHEVRRDTAGAAGALVARDANYVARFDDAGMALAVGSHDSLQLSTIALLRGSTALPMHVAQWDRSGTSAERPLRSGVVERITARQGELEWDVVLARPLPGHGDLSVVARLGGVVGAPRRVHDPDGLQWSLPHGQYVRVGEMMVKDATGAVIARAVPVVRGSTVRLEVPGQALSDAEYPVTIDPTVSPERPVAVSPPGFVNRGNPAVAFDGTNYLVVWADDRNSPLGPESVWDVYGSRVTPSGQVLDTIAISTAQDDQDSPQVSFDGTNYLVVWRDTRSDPSGDIYGARVNPQGQLVGTTASTGIPISTTSALQWQPAVAWNGTDHLVVWWDGRGDEDIYGARVTPAGAVLDATGIPISTAQGSQTAPTVASDGTNWLVVWEDHRAAATSPDIYGARVTTAGVVLDPTVPLTGGGIAISTATRWQTAPAVAWNGSRYLAVWEDQRSTTDLTDSEIYGTRVSTTGVVQDTAGIAISTGHFKAAPAVAASNSVFLVLWDEEGDDIYARRLNDAGTVLDQSNIAVGVSNQTEQAVAATGGPGSKWGVVYARDALSEPYGIYLRTVSPK